MNLLIQIIRNLYHEILWEEYSQVNQVARIKKIFN
jgi:hypothetical protein